jgi:hypothetical protein
MSSPPPRERFANAASSTLAAAITSSTTTLSVNSATLFPTTGNFRILIDTELMLVTAVSGTTFTVTRAAEGTTAANHLVNASVVQILTKGSFQRFMRDNVPFADDSSRPPFAIQDSSGNVLTSSSFTVVNGTLATVTDQNSGAIAIYKTKLSGGGEDVTFLARSAPATPYQVYAAMEGALLDASDYSGFGIGFRESSSGQMALLVLSMDGGSIFPMLAVYYMNNATSYSGSALVGRFPCYLPSPKWFSVKDDGTDLYFYASHDGIQWILVGSASRTAFMTGGPDQVGFCLSSSYNTSHDIAASLLARNGA